MACRLVLIHVIRYVEYLSTTSN